MNPEVNTFLPWQYANPQSCMKSFSALKYQIVLPFYSFQPCYRYVFLWYLLKFFYCLGKLNKKAMEGENWNFGVLKIGMFLLKVCCLEMNWTFALIPGCWVISWPKLISSRNVKQSLVYVYSAILLAHLVAVIGRCRGKELALRWIFFKIYC